MSLLVKYLVFVLIGLATCSPVNNHFDFGQQYGQNVQASQDNETEPVPTLLQPVIEIIQEECKKAGKKNIAQGYENKFREALRCIEDNLNPLELEEIKIDEALRTVNISVFKKICNIWPRLHTCLNKPLSDLKQCLDKDAQYTFDQTIGFIDDSHSFFCEKDQHRIIEFLTKGGYECLDAHSSDIDTCARSNFKNNETIEDCSDFEQLRACVRNETYKCDSKVPGQIADDYFALVQRVACNSASSLTWFSTFNVTLVLCTYLFSKMF